MRHPFRLSETRKRGGFGSREGRNHGGITKFLEAWQEGQLGSEEASCTVNLHVWYSGTVVKVTLSTTGLGWYILKTRKNTKAQLSVALVGGSKNKTCFSLVGCLLTASKSDLGQVFATVSTAVVRIGSKIGALTGSI